MDMSHVIVSYRRFLKRRNYSPHTIKNYMNILKHFVVWVNVPIEEVDQRKVAEYTDKLLSKRLKPKTINCHLACIRVFYHYLYHEEEMKIPNPVKRGSALRMPQPLPRHLRDEEVSVLLDRITKPRDKAMVMVMLRCGLRVEELAHLQLADLDLRQSRIFVRHAKGGKQRVVYISNDAKQAIVDYLRVRGPSRTRGIFLVEKGIYTGNRYRSGASRKESSTMRKRPASGSAATSCATPWPLNCSMRRPRWSPSRTSSVTTVSAPLKGTAPFQTSRS